ncbi:MAG TPA: hypothetical protein VMW54_06480 [Terriglobia bacterium]|nr:hypothetical protein [Terriglobia bacterium]
MLILTMALLIGLLVGLLRVKNYKATAYNSCRGYLLFFDWTPTPEDKKQEIEKVTSIICSGVEGRPCAY